MLHKVAFSSKGVSPKQSAKDLQRFHKWFKTGCFIHSVIKFREKLWNMGV